MWKRPFVRELSRGGRREQWLLRCVAATNIKETATLDIKKVAPAALRFPAHADCTLGNIEAVKTK